MERVPASLKGVVEPLREAEEYQRLQLQRQRGVYNVLTGLPAAFFLAWLAPGELLPGSAPWPFRIGFSLLLFGLFCVSCYPTLFLPWIKRRRPDWSSAFVDAPIVKSALEKQFWIQAGFALTGLFALPFIVMFADVVARPDPDSFMLDSWLGPSLALLHLAAMGLLALQAKRHGDMALTWLYWCLAPLSLFVFLLGLGDPYEMLGGSRILIPALLESSFRLFFVALIAPPIVVGLIRLLAPRRWLV